LIAQDLAALRHEDRLTPDMEFRDPYFLDFLGLTGHHVEKDLEDAILRDLEAFILELGDGFTFVARQKRITVDKSAEHVELLRLNDSGIRVAQYLTELPPKELLEKKLHQAIQLARERLGRKQQAHAEATNTGSDDDTKNAQQKNPRTASIVNNPGQSERV
jgi:hypothetical protein